MSCRNKVPKIEKLYLFKDGEYYKEIKVKDFYWTSYLTDYKGYKILEIEVYFETKNKINLDDFNEIYYINEEDNLFINRFINISNNDGYRFKTQRKTNCKFKLKWYDDVINQVERDKKLKKVLKK